MSELEPRPLELLEEDRVTLVNPNPGRPFTVKVPGNKRYTFEPLQRVYAPEKMAKFILDKANKGFREQRAQQKLEEETAVLFQQMGGPKNRMLSLKYCDEDGVTVTQPPEYPFVIALNTPANQEIYESQVKKFQGEKKAEEKEISVPMVDGKPKLDKPQSTWEIDQYIGFIEHHTGKAPGKNAQRSKTLLFNRALETFEAVCSDMKEKGIEFEVEE